MRNVVRMLKASWALGLIASIGLGGCYSDVHCRDPGDVAPGDRQCIGGGGAPEAVVTGVAAGALWVGGGGCKVAGCRPPMVCNERSGLCESPRCGEGYGRCPLGMECNFGKRRCE